VVVGIPSSVGANINCAHNTGKVPNCTYLYGKGGIVPPVIDGGKVVCKGKVKESAIQFLTNADISEGEELLVSYGDNFWLHANEPVCSDCCMFSHFCNSLGCPGKCDSGDRPLAMMRSVSRALSSGSIQLPRRQSSIIQAVPHSSDSLSWEQEVEFSDALPEEFSFSLGELQAKRRPESLADEPGNNCPKKAKRELLENEFNWDSGLPDWAIAPADSHFDHSAAAIPAIASYSIAPSSAGYSIPSSSAALPSPSGK
jgi:hypothetical protein